jgi:predicted nucleic acid-binding protein
VNASDIVFDTSAWWEVLRGSEAGTRLNEGYLRDSSRRVHTSAITIGELSAKLGSLGETERAERALVAIRRASELHDVTPDVAFRAGILRSELRATDGSAILADGIVVATARSIAGKLVSSDPAFRGLPDLIELE